MKGNIKLKVDKGTFDDVFVDSYDEKGYEVNGIALFEFNEIADESHIKMLELLPPEIRNLDENVALIKQSNISSYVKTNILKRIDYNKVGYSKMIKTIKMNFPEKIKQDKTFGETIEFEELENFIERLFIENSILEINNQKFHIATDDDLSCDYAKLYLSK